jgi:hypothetical protein
MEVWARRGAGEQTACAVNFKTPDPPADGEAYKVI